jgi:hypothetical protein
MKSLKSSFHSTLPFCIIMSIIAAAKGLSTVPDVSLPIIVGGVLMGLCFGVIISACLAPVVAVISRLRG